MKTINELCDPVRQTAYDIHGYLKASRVEHGLLVNFGSYRFQIRKYAFSQGRVKEEGAGRLVCLVPVRFATFAFFRG